MQDGLDVIPEEVKELNAWFLALCEGRNKNFGYKLKDEEFYYSDVDGNRTQYTNEQLNYINESYGTPISTKIIYPLVEQLLALLTGAKPYPKVVAGDEKLTEYAALFEQAHSATWYESKGNQQLIDALRDALVVGEGYLRVRKNNFYEETALNVVIEHVRWKDVFVDPMCRPQSLDDAEIICITRILPASKAEKEFDLTISKEDLISRDFLSGIGLSNDTYGLFTEDYYGEGLSINGRPQKRKTVLIREFFKKEIANLYIDELGNLSSKRPVPIEIPNPEHQQITEQIGMLKMAYQELAQQKQLQAVQQQEANQAIQDGSQSPEAFAQSANASDDVLLQMQDVEKQIAELSQQQTQIPPTLSAYQFITVSGREVQAKEYTRIKKPTIKRTLLLGNKIVDKSIIGSEKYPITKFLFLYNNTSLTTYGIVHMLRDIQIGINKSWASMLYDMSINGRPKVLAVQGSILDIPKFESSYAVPGAVVEYRHMASLADGGKPTIVPPAGLSPASVQVVDMLWKLAEYIVGLFSLTQGNPESAPQTLGGTNTYANFGTQRFKLHGRYMETSLQDLSYNIVRFVQLYAPREKVLMYMDEDGNQQEIKILDDAEDVRFKVRTNISANLPTTKQMFAHLLSLLATQTGNPAMADLLTEEALKVMDLPESSRLIERMDTVKNLQQQVQTMGQELDALSKENKMVKNQLTNSELAQKKAIAENDIKNEKENISEKLGQLEEQVDSQINPIPTNF
jgi:hypothetical protein